MKGVDEFVSTGLLAEPHTFNLSTPFRMRSVVFMSTYALVSVLGLWVVCYPEHMLELYSPFWIFFQNLEIWKKSFRTRRLG